MAGSGEEPLKSGGSPTQTWGLATVPVAKSSGAGPLTEASGYRGSGSGEAPVVLGVL